MDVVSQERHLEAIGQRFAAVAPNGWARLVGSWEATQVEGGPVRGGQVDGGQVDGGQVSLNWVTLAVVDGDDRWLFGQVSYDEPLYDLVADLHAWSSRQGESWTVLDLEVDRDGGFRSGFGYGETTRTNGSPDDESSGRFERYLDTWVLEHGSDPRTAPRSVS